MRDTDGLQTTITLGPVNRDGQTLTLELGLQMTLPMPDQDEHLPDRKVGTRRASIAPVSRSNEAPPQTDEPCYNR